MNSVQKPRNMFRLNKEIFTHLCLKRVGQAYMIYNYILMIVYIKIVPFKRKRKSKMAEGLERHLDENEVSFINVELRRPSSINLNYLQI